MDIAIINSNCMTKSDLHVEFSTIHQEFVKIHQTINSQTKWMIAGMLSTAGLSLALARWMF